MWAADKYNGDLVIFRESDDHAPIATEVDNAETLDLVALKAPVGCLAAAALQVIHRLLRVGSHVALKFTQHSVADW
jgi:hypothetical protein